MKYQGEDRMDGGFKLYVSGITSNLTRELELIRKTS